MERQVTWNELTAEQKQQAIESYACIREAEEGRPCSLIRAEEATPSCRGFYIQEDGYVFVDI